MLTFTNFTYIIYGFDIDIAKFIKLAHLVCFSTAWGTTVWMVVIGINMFKYLSRHEFGNIRSKMFPVYLMLVGICCTVSVGCFQYTHPWKFSSTSEKYQLGILVCACIFNLSNLFFFTPMTIRVMKQRHKAERKLKIGDEIGWKKNHEVAKVNPNLAKMNFKFGMIHGVAALALIISFSSLAMHSWYLANKIDL